MSKKINLDVIYNEYKAKKSINEIVRITGYSKTTILKYLKNSGLWEDRQIDIDISKIIDMYQNNKKSIKVIAKILDISPNTVRKYLYKHNIEIRDNRKVCDDQMIINLYNSGLLVKEISDQTKYSEYSISSCLKRHNIKLVNHTFHKLNNQEILDFYEKTKSLINTSQEFNLSTYTIKKILIKNGYKRKNFRGKNWDKSNDQKIINLYHKGLSAEEIGNRFGYCHTTILRHLRRLNIDKRKTSTKIYKNIPDIFIGSIKRSSNIRGIEFKLSKTFLYKLFLKQDQKCAISGVNIKFAETYDDYISGANTCSLDRIDSNKAYTKNNVQWVHKTVNIMKSSLIDTEFIQWCKIISTNNP